MVRLVAFLVVIAAAATGLSWLADRPGRLVIDWQGYEIETSVFRAIVLLALLVGMAILLWSLLVQVWRSPAMLGSFFTRRRQVRGLEALSGGMIAIGSGDRSAAMRYAVQARRALPNEPLTHLLRAQAAQLSGDRVTARRIFEAMIASPETEQLGLRGLFLEAEREGEKDAARQYAGRALKLNPKLGWPIDALLDMQCKDADWDGALETLTVARKSQHLDGKTADRRRAVLLTARAQALEDSDPLRSQQLALEAHQLAADLVPAAAIAGRLLAARGNTQRAARILQRTWRASPHPDLATAYAHARIGDSPRDRLERIRQLAQLAPHSAESAIAVAHAAIEARDWGAARHALAALTGERQTARVCTLMARIEGEEFGDRGRVREWLARAVHAPPDPVWTADGVVSETWQPASPVTGALDAFQWRVPVEAQGDRTLIEQKLEELARLGMAHDAIPGVASEVSSPAVSRPPTELEPEPRTETQTEREPAAPTGPREEPVETKSANGPAAAPGNKPAEPAASSAASSSTSSSDPPHPAATPSDPARPRPAPSDSAPTGSAPT